VRLQLGDPLKDGGQLGGRRLRRGVIELVAIIIEKRIVPRHDVRAVHQLVQLVLHPLAEGPWTLVPARRMGAPGQEPLADLQALLRRDTAKTK
jgi:hypothetical protein